MLSFLPFLCPFTFFNLLSHLFISLFTLLCLLFLNHISSHFTDTFFLPFCVALCKQTCPALDPSPFSPSFQSSLFSSFLCDLPLSSFCFWHKIGNRQLFALHCQMQNFISLINMISITYLQVTGLFTHSSL